MDCNFQKMKRLAVYAHFGRSAKVALHVFHFLGEIRSLGFEVCFVSNSPVSVESRAEVAKYCGRFIQRENKGYDFAMWQAGLAEYELAGWDELLLTNSSIIGPLAPLAPLWQKAVVEPCDFWGLTDNDEAGKHLQSYFLVFKRAVLHSAAFRRFWHSVLPYQDKQFVIQNYEIGLTRWLEENGFKWQALFPQDEIWMMYLRRRSLVKRIADRLYWRGLPGRNTTTLAPDLLLQSGMPFLKAALLQERELQVSPKMALQLLGTSGLPREILEELCAR
jgi:lipopolysaccharide biosynthesis protein